MISVCLSRSDSSACSHRGDGGWGERKGGWRGEMEKAINRSSTQSERREEAKQVERQRREEDGQLSEKNCETRGWHIRGGWWKRDGAGDSAASLDLDKAPPSFSFLSDHPPLPPRGTTPRCISALSAATTFTPHEDESVEGFGADPTMGGSQRRSGRRVILSLEYHRTPTRATGSGLMWQPYCPVYRHSHKRNLRLL